MDKSVVGKNIKPKGREYCDQPGTSCCYNEHEVCVSCGRKKGWRTKARVTETACVIRHNRMAANVLADVLRHARAELVKEYENRELGRMEAMVDLQIEVIDDTLEQIA